MLKILKPALLIMLCCALIFSCSNDKGSSDKEKARVLLLESVQKIVSIGGLGGFRFPKGFERNVELSSPKTVQELSQRAESAASGLQKALKLDPELKEAYYYLGVAYVFLQNVDQSILAFEKTVEYFPQDSDTTDYLTGLYLAAGKNQEAITLCLRSMEKFPGQKADSQGMLALCYLDSKEYQKALEVSLELLQADDSYSILYVLVGHSHYGMGNIKEANIYYAKAIKLDPEVESIIKQFKTTGIAVYIKPDLGKTAWP